MELIEKLTNVRRAARLIAAYNRRVMTILGTIERQLQQQQQLGLAFNKWSSTHFSNIGKQTTAVVGRWGWDFINLYDAWFRWTRDGRTDPVVSRSKTRLPVAVRVRHIMDDGYSPTDGTEPDPRSFEDAEKSGSWFEIELLCIRRGSSDDGWDKLEAARDAALSEDVRWSGEVVAVSVDDVSNASTDFAIQHIGWRVSMAELDSAESVSERIEVRLQHAMERVVIALGE
jgi:hypothetical protein